MLYVIETEFLNSECFNSTTIYRNSLCEEGGGGGEEGRDWDTEGWEVELRREYFR